jgi:hypothetical protein
MLIKAPNNRASAKELLDDPYLQEYSVAWLDRVADRDRKTERKRNVSEKYLTWENEHAFGSQNQKSFQILISK